jgi:hypothetical protein
MSDVRAIITLDGGNTVFKPGDSVSGSVELRADSGWTCEYVDVVAGWRTSGRGDSDHEGEASLRLFKPGEALSPIVDRRFTLRLPPMPWSYQGVALKINWTIGVYVCAEGGKEQYDQVHIVVHPRPESFASRNIDEDDEGAAE